MTSFDIQKIALSYGATIKLMHYCRLIYRVIDYPSYNNAVLGMWLSKVISSICEVMHTREQYEHLKATTMNLED